MLPNLVVLTCVSSTFSRLRSFQVPCPSCISTHTHSPILTIPSSLFLLVLYAHLFHNHLALRHWATHTRTSAASADRVSSWHDTTATDKATDPRNSSTLVLTSHKAAADARRAAEAQTCGCSPSQPGPSPSSVNGPGSTF
jgi:hypothetical protein